MSKSGEVKTPTTPGRIKHLNNPPPPSTISEPKKKESEWKLEIHQLDVGQGDSALVLFKKLNPTTKKHEVEKSILIDGGLGYNEDYLKDYISNQIGEKHDGTKRSLDAVVITHFDVDHCFGIAQMMFIMSTTGGGKKISEITKAKQNSLFTKHTKFVLPALNGKNSKPAEENGNQINAGLVKFYEEKDSTGKSNILRSYNFLGKTIWDVFGVAKPESAPDLKFIAAENAFERDDSLTPEDMVQLALDSDDNQRSAVSLIKMDGVRFYTAGDFENSRGLVEHLSSRSDAKDHFPIQVFLSPHHGSAQNFPRVNKLFADKIGARATLISAGENNYGHPNLETLRTIKSSKTTFAYLTNPAVEDKSQSKTSGARDKVTDKKAIILQDSKFIMTGKSGEVTGGTTKDKKPRGTIKFQTYQNIAEVGGEKFMVKYKGTESKTMVKTRDYFKDKDFAVLKKELMSIIKVNDEEKCKLEQGDKIVIYLSKNDLRHFLDEGKPVGENKKLKHLNPATLKEFFDSYKGSVKSRDYILSISMGSTPSFEISSNFFHQNNGQQPNPRRLGHQEKTTALFNKVKELKTSLVGDQEESIGLFLSADERKYFLAGSTLTSLVEARKKDKIKDGDLFLEVIDPREETTISTKIWERKKTPLLRKEYHQDARHTTIKTDDQSTPANSFSKVVARRMELGTKEDRTIP